METVVLLLIALSVLHYAVVFYSTMARKLVGWAVRLAGRRDAVTARRGGAGGDPAGQDTSVRG